MIKSSKTDKPKKTDRLEVRVTEESKKNIEAAAYLRGQNLTEYVLDVLTAASQETIRQHQLLELTKNDLNSFVDALLNPTIPTEQAIHDAKWYKKIIAQNNPQ
jgi:uncharacterized protein (DUF1778 family)